MEVGDGGRRWMQGTGLPFTLYAANCFVDVLYTTETKKRGEVGFEVDL